MSRIRVLSDHLANQIAAGEVVERPASVAKELVENSIDAGARRVEVTIEAGGRRLLRVVDDGSGMTRDDAVLAFERHATSKISTTEDLAAIHTLGFRGEALASIASVARVELLTCTAEDAEATRVQIEGGRLRDVAPAAHPRGTTFVMRDLFFNVPARRKFLRSEATESFHLTNLVTHYALAHPEIEFVLTNNGREILRASPAQDLRERAYQIFGAEFVGNLLAIEGGHPALVRVRGFTSAPRERRTSADAQYLFVNGRFIRDRLVRRALSEGYRSVLPHGVYPAALLFLEVPFEEVDVNVHPAKTEVRFRRAAAIADAVRESIRAALARAGFVRDVESYVDGKPPEDLIEDDASSASVALDIPTSNITNETLARDEQSSDSLSSSASSSFNPRPQPDAQQTHIGFNAPVADDEPFAYSLALDKIDDVKTETANTPTSTDADDNARDALRRNAYASSIAQSSDSQTSDVQASDSPTSALPQFDSASHLAREVEVATLSSNIRPLGQLDESFIIATDDEGLLLIDQHVAHERILFDKYRRMEATRAPDSQNLLLPETFDLTPAQATAFDHVQAELEAYGYRLMRLSGRTIAIAAVPADLPASEARNLLTEVLETIDAERRGQARASLRDRIAASLACRAAVKINTPLSTEKMQWLIDRVLTTSSPTTCPHGRPVILRITVKDIWKGFHRT